MLRSILFSAIAAVLGVGVGYAIASPVSMAILIPGSDRPERAAKQVREILADPEPLDRVTRLGSLLSRLGPEAVPAVTAEFDSAPLNRADAELVLLGSWWGRFDPDAAWEWAQKDWRADDPTVIRAVVRSWAHRDPEAAIGHAAGLPLRPLARMAVAAAMAGWEESGRPGLAEYVEAISDPVTKQKVAEVLAERKVVALGPDRALAWADEQSESFAVIMRPRVASAVAVADPAVAADWAEPRIKAAAEAAARPTGLPRRIGTRWVQYDPEAAMAWLASLPAGPDRDDGVTESIRTWVRSDMARARAWIESLELERWNEPVFAFYARSLLSPTEPQRALELAARFQDEELRNAVTTLIARWWLTRDYQAADAWLKRADLPPDVRELAYTLPTPEVVPLDTRAKLGDESYD